MNALSDLRLRVKTALGGEVDSKQTKKKARARSKNVEHVLKDATKGTKVKVGTEVKAHRPKEPKKIQVIKL
jgi:hypothetical protein